MLENISSTRYQFVAWVGVIGHPLYYWYWNSFYPEYEDSAFLRFGTATFFFVLLLSNYWPDRLKKCKSYLWYFCLMLALPSVFTYTLLANNYSSLWLATHVGMLLILLVAVRYARPFYLLLVPGTLIGVLWYKVTIGGDVLAHFPVEYIPLLLFVNFIGLSFSYLSTQNIVQIEKGALVELEQQKAIYLKSLAGTIAHEMRNPLSQINGTLHLLWDKKAPNSPESDMYLNGLKQVIKSSFQLIDITMDAINEKPIKKDNFQCISALHICNEAVSDYAYKDLAYRKKVSVTGIDFQILADPVLVKYILYNLIGNALYYVQNMLGASIVISMLPATRQIQVRDTGPGIAPENITNIFDSFFTSGKESGTGLGLAYCKRTMLALGGEIYCESEFGEFTAFRLSFPEVAMQKSA